MSSQIRSNIFKKRYLALFAFVLSVLIVTGGTYLYKRYEKVIKAEKIDELHAISDLKSNQITEWKRERTSDAIYYSQSKLTLPDFEKWIKNLSDKPSRKDITDKLKLTKESHKYVDIQLFSAKSDLMYSFNDEKSY